MNSGYPWPLPLLPGSSGVMATRDAHVPLLARGDDSVAGALDTVDRSALRRRAHNGQDDAEFCHGTGSTGEIATQEQPFKVQLPAFLAS